MCGGFPSANVKRTLSLGVGILTFPSGGGVGGVGGKRQEGSFSLGVGILIFPSGEGWEG